MVLLKVLLNVLDDHRRYYYFRSCCQNEEKTLARKECNVRFFRDSVEGQFLGLYGSCFTFCVERFM